MLTPRERIYLRHTGAPKLLDVEFFAWMTNVLRSARHQRDLFTANGKVRDEAQFLAWLKKHYPAKEKME